MLTEKLFISYASKIDYFSLHCVMNYSDCGKMTVCTYWGIESVHLVAHKTHSLLEQVWLWSMASYGAPSSILELHFSEVISISQRTGIHCLSFPSLSTKRKAYYKETFI